MSWVTFVHTATGFGRNRRITFGRRAGDVHTASQLCNYSDRIWYQNQEMPYAKINIFAR
jgi:hypothetical protein